MRAALVPPLPLRPPRVPAPLLLVVLVAAATLLVLGGRAAALAAPHRNRPAAEDEEEHVVASSHQEPEELLIAGFFPTTVNLSEGAIGRGVVPAVNLALRHINSSPHFLPGYKLDIIWNDTQVCSRSALTLVAPFFRCLPAPRGPPLDCGGLRNPHTSHLIAERS
ncbi:hypothetical protein V5799_031258 [Amblyomma americanum]|uniref:Uncharacterized protein n=1 Tax=Amblyomma americanum TaxID=6943 RepID=A0AAQ4EL01_AMBAM